MPRVYSAESAILVTTDVECESCGKPYAIEQIINYIISNSANPRAAERVEDAIQSSIKKLDHSFTLIAKERCPRCRYMQSWMLGDERSGDALARASIIGAIAAGLALAWLLLTGGEPSGDKLQVYCCIPGIVFLILAIPIGIIRYHTYDPNQGRSATKQNLPKITVRRSENYTRLPEWEQARFGGAPFTVGVHAAGKVRTVRLSAPGETGDRSVDSTDDSVSPDVLFKNY